MSCIAFAREQLKLVPGLILGVSVLVIGTRLVLGRSQVDELVYLIKRVYMK